MKSPSNENSFDNTMKAISSLFFVICATALVVDVTSHPNPHTQGRIGGGNDAPLNHFTYQVSIRQAKNHVCSGTIISKRWVLTVCSCVKDFKTKDLKVYYGSRFLTSDAYITKVFQIFKHPEFNENNLDNNVAMLSTSSDMEFVENMVGPVNLPREQEPHGHQFLISGWRATDVRMMDPSIQFYLLEKLKNIINDNIIPCNLFRERPKLKQPRIACNINTHN